MIRIDGITKKFEDFTALNNISFDIPDGSIFGLVGTNGAGKSTLIRLLTGVYIQDQGEILYDEKRVFDNPEVKNDVAYVSDELYFLPGASMDRMAGFYKTMYSNFSMDRYKTLVEGFGLDRKKNIANFSKGMKRQAATVLALSTMAKYLFFDETFDGLDPIMRNVVKSVICDDVMERKSTIVITSHSLRELEDTCDQLALLHKGGLVLQSDISELKTNIFKVQVAFADEYDKSRFEGFDIVHFVKRGSVANIIIKGDREEITKKMQALNPLIMDAIPLTLEEIFSYEVEALGYDFSKLINGGEN